MKITTFMCGLLLSVVSLFTMQNVSTADWQRIDAEGLFTFSLPRGFSKQSTQTSENKSGEYYNGSTRVVWKWRPEISLPYSEQRQTSMHDYEETTTRIRGLRASIRTYSKIEDGKRMYHAELNVGNWEKGELQLYMGIQGADSSVLSMASEIFRSIVLPMPDPERPGR